MKTYNNAKTGFMKLRPFQSPDVFSPYEYLLNTGQRAYADIVRQDQSNKPDLEKYHKLLEKEMGTLTDGEFRHLNNDLMTAESEMRNAYYKYNNWQAAIMSEEGYNALTKLNNFASNLNQAKNHKADIDSEYNKLKERGALNLMYVGEDMQATGETNMQYLERLKRDPNENWRNRTSEFGFKGYTDPELHKRKEEWMQGVPTLTWDDKTQRPGYIGKDNQTHYFHSLDEMYNDPSLSPTDKLLMFSSSSGGKHWDNSTGWFQAKEGMQSMLATDADLRASVESRWAMLGKDAQKRKSDAVTTRINTENDKIRKHNQKTGGNIALIPIPKTDKESAMYAKHFFGQDFISDLFMPQFNKANKSTGTELNASVIDLGNGNGENNKHGNQYTALDQFDFNIPGPGLSDPAISWNQLYQSRTDSMLNYNVEAGIKYPLSKLSEIYDNEYKSWYASLLPGSLGRSHESADFNKFLSYFHKEGENYVANTEKSNPNNGPLLGASSKVEKVQRLIPSASYGTAGQQNEIVKDIQENIIVDATGKPRTLKDLGVTDVIYAGKLQSVHPNVYNGRSDNLEPSNMLSGSTVYKVKNIVKMPKTAILNQSASNYDKWITSLTREGITDRKTGSINEKFRDAFTTYIVADIEIPKDIREGKISFEKFDGANKISATKYGYANTLLKETNWQKDDPDYIAYKKYVESNYPQWTKEVTASWTKMDNASDLKQITDADGTVHYILEGVMIPVADIGSFQKRTESNKYQLENRAKLIRQNPRTGSVAADNSVIYMYQSDQVK